MKINRDFFNNPIVPDYILCKANKERIGVLQCTEKCIDFKFNDLDEITFTTYLYVNNERNPYYDAVDVMKYILLPDIGFYSIISVDIQSEGTEFECKKVVAKSYECLLAQKYLEEFVINMGTDESIDGVQFYNIGNQEKQEKSLLHLILEKCPDWKIGHIDDSLQTMQRSFEVSRQDVYSFLNNDVAEAFSCVFLFDTLHNTINIYEEDRVGKDTNIHVSYVNLLKSTSLSCTTDNIKTCLTITGSDDLTIREINMGYDRIYNFDYYNSTEYMSQKLYDAYNKWIALRNSRLSTYNTYLSKYQDFYNQINLLTHGKIPPTAGSTNWSEYGLIPLKEQLEAYEQKLTASMKKGHGDPSSPYYVSEYSPIYTTIQSIKSQIIRIELDLKVLQAEQAQKFSEMSEIISEVDMRKNFKEDELKELSSFIREDELNSSNYIVTDTMSIDEKYEMLNDLLKFSKNQLAKASVPQISFSADMVNLFAIPEFEAFHQNFEPGNYIWVTLRDDFAIKTKLLSVHVNFFDPTDFSVTFGNVIRKSKDRCVDIAEIIREATSAATSVAFNASYWSQSAKDTSTIGKILDEGLLAAGKYLKNGDDSEMVIDTRGIFVNTTSGDYAYKDSIFIGGGRILFTSDNWETVSMSVGRADITINGITESRFGTFADFVIAGYVGGSTLEGDEILGGTIKSSNYVTGKSGTLIDLNNGTFEFNANNEQKLTLDTSGILTVKGIVKAEEGWIGGKDAFVIKNGKVYCGKDSLTSNANGVYIGTDGIALGAKNVLKLISDGTLYAEKGYLGGENGFVLEKNKLYNGKSSISDTSNGIYLGTDGIALGADNVFSVTPKGYLTTKYGSIGGATITNNSIHASNNNWWIGSDGSASFKNVTITDNSTFGSSITNPFSGTTIPHIESLAANYIKVNYLDAMNADINNLYANEAQLRNLIATKASITDLDAAVARIGTLETTKISSNEVYTNFMEVKNWAFAGYIRADKIDVEELTGHIINSKYFNGAVIKCSAINITGGLNQSAENIIIGGTSYSKKSANVRFADGTTGTITYLGA